MNLKSFIWTMWDVNIVEPLLLTFVPVFYMDYVGCKFSSYVKILKGIFKFYMDYVGCKSLTKRKFSLSFLRFYMDYVGCKSK